MFLNQSCIAIVKTARERQKQNKSKNKKVIAKSYLNKDISINEFF